MPGSPPECGIVRTTEPTIAARCKGVVAVGPNRNEPTDVVVYPFFAVYDPAALEPYLCGRAIADRAMQIQ